MPAIFRFNAQTVFLTYSQCEPLTKEDVYYTLAERFNIAEYKIGEELHANDGRHIHAYIKFTGKINTTDVTAFDIPDPTLRDADYHPNIQSVKRGKAHHDRVLDYVGKEDICPFTNIPERLTWGEIIEQSNTKDEFLGNIRRHYPREFVLNQSQIQTTASKLFTETTPNTIVDFVPHADYECPESLRNLVWPAMKSLCIVGPPGCGKTTWAKLTAPKPALFVTHMDALAEYIAGYHASLIFDDMIFSHLPEATQKYIVDLENSRTIHRRYGVVHLPACLPRVFTANEYPFKSGWNRDAEAIARRIERLDL